MKILHISTINEWRGGDKQLLTTIDILKSYPEMEHHVLCAEGSVLSKKCKEGNIPFDTALRKSKFSIPFLRKIIKVVNKKDIDTVHVHDSNALSLSLFAIKFLPNVRLLYTRKRNNRIKINYFKKKKYNNHRITGILCVSQAVKDVLVPVLNEPEKATVIYDGIDVKNISQTVESNILRKEFTIPADTLLIGNIAGLSKQKDFFTFFDAAKIIQGKIKEKVKFIVIGEGPLEKEIKEYADDLGLTKHVIFTGFRNDVHKILPEFDLFLISSQTEGLPLSVLEAFSCRVPVVATAAGGMGEAVKQRVTGMISPVKDSVRLASNALEVLNDKKLAATIKENAFQLVSKKFTLEVMKENYYNYYMSRIS